MAVPLSHMIINEIVFDNYGDPYEFSSSLVYYILLVLSYSLGLYIFTVRYLWNDLDAHNAVIQESTIYADIVIKYGI